MGSSRVRAAGVAFLFSPHAFGLLRPSFEGNGGSKAGAMSEEIWGVKTPFEGAWYYGTRVLSGLVIGLDVNPVFAERMTHARAEALAKRMEDVTGAPWYVWAVARRAA